MLKNRERVNPILLDTHIWIWLINGDKKIQSLKFLHLIEEAVSYSKVFVSVISVWEVAMLEAKKKIVLPYNCLEWVQRALRAPGIALSPLTPEIAIESTRLPGDFHGDPADRIIVATAKDNQATLVTCDHHILEYSQEHHFQTVSP